MFEKFNAPARKVMAVANQEALRMGDAYVSPGHILLALMKLKGCAAQRALAELGISLPAVRRSTKRLRAKSDKGTGFLIPLPRTKQVIERAVTEADRLRHDYVGTEHLLLGLVSASEGKERDLIFGIGVEADAIQRELPRFYGCDEELRPPS